MTVEILAVFWIRFMTKKGIYTIKPHQILYLMWPVM